MIDYGFVKIIDGSFEETVKKVISELKEEGFGVLTTIDAQSKFKEKLGIEFKKYIILGACNPNFAHKALSAEENIGLVLPCNVIVYEHETKIAAAVIRPAVAMKMIENNNLTELAAEVENKLKNVIDKMELNRDYIIVKMLTKLGY